MPIGGPELAIILVIVLVLFGPSQLPKIGKMIGQTSRSIREGLEGPQETEPKPKKKAAPAAVEPEPEEGAESDGAEADAPAAAGEAGVTEEHTPSEPAEVPAARKDA